ncbi:hypothetical protein DOTSEDRAFT_76383 [Dothistroma septosporum NZE10]|uniref:Uncharacterized protein n=1 Tax=Dothistroma septosporum (strain NZE10 / CBS 128990) TaxID=675120 RepID=N1PZD5_DOTSN|nr:hypothetical protein DOTSEDRAFT_76383 [Dothistroma septosporum NZE10]
MSSQPALVLIHGPWHQPLHYNTVVEKLRGQGSDVNAPAMASAADTAVRNVFETDVGIARKAIKSFADAHDGGVYGSEAVAELCEEAEGEAGAARVLHLYVAAFTFEKSMSLTNPGTTPHALDVEDGLPHHLEPYDRFYAKTPRSVARKTISQLKP